MRPKSLILLGLALGCGLVASIGISQVLDGNNRNQVAVETVPIYVAMNNINLGDPVDDTMVSLQEWPKDKVPMGAISKWEDIDGRRPRTAIFRGEPLNDSKLLARGESHDPIAGIPPGMRLKTVLVDARKSAAGLLSPGDRVDVQIFVQRNERANIMSSFTKIFLQNIRVYAVDQSVQRSADGMEDRTIAKTISLLLTPQQANRMTTAENLGEVSLIPRHPDDNIIVDDWEQSTDDLFGRSDSSDRKSEREAFDQLEAEKGIRGAIKEEIDSVAVVPPFRMKIMYPDKVDHMDFSIETGEPLDRAERQPDMIDVSPKAEPTEQGEPAVADDPGTVLEPEVDFPIDFSRK